MRCGGVRLRVKWYHTVLTHNTATASYVHLIHWNTYHVDVTVHALACVHRHVHTLPLEATSHDVPGKSLITLTVACGNYTTVMKSCMYHMHCAHIKKVAIHNNEILLSSG